MILLLQLSDEVIFELDLFQTLVISGIGLRGLDTILFLLCSKDGIRLLKLLNFFLVSCVLILYFSQLIVPGLQFVLFQSLLLLLVDHILSEQLALSHLGLNLLLEVFYQSGLSLLLRAVTLVFFLQSVPLSSEVVTLLLRLSGFLSHNFPLF